MFSPETNEYTSSTVTDLSTLLMQNTASCTKGLAASRLCPEELALHILPTSNGYSLCRCDEDVFVAASAAF
jgi:hypothetical protein